MGDSTADESRSPARPPAAGGASLLDRLASFRTYYAAIVVFMLLYVGTIAGVQTRLEGYFQAAVNRAIRVDPANGPVTAQIQGNVRRLVQRSFWTRIGGVDVKVFVLGSDGSSLYTPGLRPLPPPDSDPLRDIQEAMRLLPATAQVIVSVPPSALLSTSILVIYLSALTTGLFFLYRASARRDAEILRSAVSARDAAAERTVGIERELEQTRRRLAEVQPAEQADAQEIEALQRERAELQQKLDVLAEREHALRAAAGRSGELEQEIQALEDLLEEAVEDLGGKEGEIQSLQERLKRASRAEPAGARARPAEQLARRLRTLYKELEIDDRAIQDLVDLRDETMKLKAEEGIKRLCDGADHAAIRRKVGGLPPQRSIFELGFAGKGRIYYTRGRQKRHRILAIGAKNSQKTDLEYLSRLPPD